MAKVETYTATACGDETRRFEVIRWIVDEIPETNLVAVRLDTAEARFVCARVDRSKVNRTPTTHALMCVDSGFCDDVESRCIDQWEC